MMFFLSDEMPFSFDELLLFGAASGGKAIEDTATGNPLVFLTDLARPLKSLSIPFTPIQQGTGDPSPSNIRPIVPWDGLTVKHGGKNLLNVASENVDRASGTYTYTDGAIHIEVVGAGNSDYVAFKQKIPAGTYTLSCSASGGVGYANLLLDIPVSGWEYVGYYGGYVKAAKTGVLTIAANSDFHIGIIVKTGTAGIEGTIEAIQLEAGNTATAYEPYVPITETDIPFPSTVYGGEHEVVSGRLAGRVFVDASFKWGDATSRTVIGNVERRGFVLPLSTKTQDELAADVTARFCSVAPWKYNYSSDDVHFYGGGWSFYVFLPVGTDEDLEIQVVAERPLQPQEIQLTPAQITAIVGNNTIWSDADGTMTAVYFKKA